MKKTVNYGKPLRAVVNMKYAEPCLTHEPDMACVGDCFLLFIILLNPVDKDLVCISRQEHPLSVPHFLLTVCESKRHKLQITSQQINIYFKVSKT